MFDGVALIAAVALAIRRTPGASRRRFARRGRPEATETADTATSGVPVLASAAEGDTRDRTSPDGR
jgi:hypothetical protein